MVMERQYISADRFIEIVEHPEYDDRKVELVEGVIVDMPKTRWQAWTDCNAIEC